MKKHVVILSVVFFILIVWSSIPSECAQEVPPPDQTGPYHHVGWFRVVYFVPPFGMYLAMIRYPAVRDGWHAPLDTSGAPYPGIVVANGLLGSDWQITWIPLHLVSYGYVTLCFTPPHRFSFDTTQWASGFSGGFRALQTQNIRPRSPLKDALDNQTWGAIGLSMGGGGCVEATGTPGSMIDAAVALAPAGFPSVLAAARNITVPVQLQVGTLDGLVSPESVLRMYTGNLTNLTIKEYLAITGGNHVGFIDEYYAQYALDHGIDNPPGITVEQQHNISRRYFTAWFQYHLRHLDDYFTYIFGAAAQQDVEHGVLADLRFNIP